ncbi:hypothetical protein ACJX0J_042379, partial [Zea mays]
MRDSGCFQELLFIEEIQNISSSAGSKCHSQTQRVVMLPSIEEDKKKKLGFGDWGECPEEAIFLEKQKLRFMGPGEFAISGGYQPGFGFATYFLAKQSFEGANEFIINNLEKFAEDSLSKKVE